MNEMFLHMTIYVITIALLIENYNNNNNRRANYHYATLFVAEHR